MIHAPRSARTCGVRRGSGQAIHLLLIFTGSDPIDLFESQYIIADAGITDLIGDLADGLGIVGDHFLRTFDPFVPDIFGDRHAVYGLEQEVQFMIAGIGLFQDRIHRKGIRTIIFRNIGFHFPDKAEVVLIIDGRPMRSAPACCGDGVPRKYSSRDKALFCISSRLFFPARLQDMIEASWDICLLPNLQLRLHVLLRPMPARSFGKGHYPS